MENKKKINGKSVKKGILITIMVVVSFVFLFFLSIHIHFNHNYVKKPFVWETEIKKDMKEISKLIDPDGSEVLNYSKTSAFFETGPGERRMDFRSSTGKEYNITVDNNNMKKYNTTYFNEGFENEFEINKKLTSKHGVNLINFVKENEIKVYEESNYYDYFSINNLISIKHNFEYDTETITTLMFENKATYEEILENYSEEIVLRQSENNPGLTVRIEEEDFEKINKEEIDIMYKLYLETKKLKNKNFDFILELESKDSIYFNEKYGKETLKEEKFESIIKAKIK